MRRHAQCYVKGEEWPTYPAEAELGLDRRTKEKQSEVPSGGPAARRSRSRSHSLGRIMRDLEDVEVTENDQHEIEGMIETYEVARESGQSVEDSAATVAVVYELDENEVATRLKRYVKNHSKEKGHPRMGPCLEMLQQLRRRSAEVGERTERIRQAVSEENPAPVESTKPAPRLAFTPPPGLGARPSASGPAIRSLEGDGARNPLLEANGLVNQLFGGSARTVEDLSGTAPYEQERGRQMTLRLPPGWSMCLRASGRLLRERRRTRQEPGAPLEVRRHLICTWPEAATR